MFIIYMDIGTGMHLSIFLLNSLYMYFFLEMYQKLLLLS